MFSQTQIVSTTTRFAFVEPANALECHLLAINQEIYNRPGTRFLAEKYFEKASASGSPTYPSPTTAITFDPTSEFSILFYPCLC